MPQIIGVVIGVVVIGEILRWVVQWVWAVFTWVWEILILPFFIYLTPSAFVLLFILAMVWGSWISTQNYWVSLKVNVNSEGMSGKLTQSYIITVLVLFVATLYISFVITFAMSVYEPAQTFVSHVAGHYDSVQFPAFSIRKLFGGF